MKSSVRVAMSIYCIVLDKVALRKYEEKPRLFTPESES